MPLKNNIYCPYYMSADFRTVLIRDSRLSDISDNQVFAVTLGPSNNTYQQFTAVITSASNIVFQI